MAQNPRRVGFHLPLRCQKHGRLTFVREAYAFTTLNSGCNQPCLEIRPCGHRCPELCHPWGHESSLCPEQCQKTLQCGHPCSQHCGVGCSCDICSAQEKEQASKLPGKGLVVTSREKDNSALWLQRTGSREEAALSKPKEGGEWRDDLALKRVKTDGRKVWEGTYPVQKNARKP